MQQKKNSFIKTVDKYLDKLEMTIEMLAFWGMLVIVLISIVLRYVLKVPNKAGEEIARYLLVTVVFVGISMCMRVKGHMGVTIFVDHLPNRLRNAVRCFADLLTTATVFAVSVFACRYTIAGTKHPQISVATGLPMYVMYGVMAFGFSISTVRLAMLFWNDYISKTHPLSPEEGENDK